jgi:hypothetical protein
MSALATAAESESTAAIQARQRDRFRHLARNGITAGALDDFESFLTAPDTLSRSSLIVRCRVGAHDCNIRVVVDRPASRPRLTRSFRPFLTRIRDRVRRPADFFVLLSDNVYVRDTRRARFVEFLENVPFLRCDQRPDDEISAPAILIPDFGIQSPEYADDLVAIERAASAMPFESRRDEIKWRGALSGPVYPDLDNYRDFPRYTLLALSMAHPDKVDARLTTLDNMFEGEATTALRRHLRATLGDLAEVVPAEGFVRHKYLISIDGAVAAWKRVPTILASGSVLLLQHRWQQFFYPGLKPWVHFLPLQPDICDLMERYEWLVTHPSHAKTIADNGRRFAREVLRPAALQGFLADTIDTCAALYRA